MNFLFEAFTIIKTHELPLKVETTLITCSRCTMDAELANPSEAPVFFDLLCLSLVFNVIFVNVVVV